MFLKSLSISNGGGSLKELCNLNKEYIHGFGHVFCYKAVSLKEMSYFISERTENVMHPLLLRSSSNLNFLLLFIYLSR